VDRRQVHHVEAHGRHLVEARLDVGERAVAPPPHAGRPGEELVPGRKARPLGVDEHRQLGTDGRGTEVAGAPEEVLELGGLKQVCDRAQRGALAQERIVRHGGLEASGRDCQGFGVGGEGAAPYPFGPHGGAGEELRPEGQVDGHVLAVVRLDEGVASPAGEAVDHGHDLEAVPAEVLRRKRRPPPVVPERGHRHARPAPRPGGPVAYLAGQCVVPVAEDVGLDDDGLADRGLRRVAPAVDLRPDPFDDRAHQADRRFRQSGGALDRGRVCVVGHRVRLLILLPP